MSIDTAQVRQCLNAFDFKRLFIQELNWSYCTNRPLDLEIDADIARISPLAELGGVVVYQVELLNSGDVPSSMVRRQIENKIKQLTHEHIIIFVDSGRTKSVWQWVRRGGGFQTATREHTYYKTQPGDSLMAKLDGIAFDISELDIDRDGSVKVIKVVERLKKAFDVEKVTKRFYDEFKKQHDTFRGFLKGIPEPKEQAWYVSIMLNRLMFIYFIQKKGFLAGDMNYLGNKLRQSRLQAPGQFYDEFLIRLFFDGFAKEQRERDTDTRQLLGDVPYLNGGIFQKHKLEEENPDITIPDAAFEGIIAFFDRYSWHLEYRPYKPDNEINPDVLGYIFEKYINKKQMGAYYTKEDITDYICKNTIVPLLFDKLENVRSHGLHPLPIKDVEPYIYDAVKQKDYLPTETEREYHARQKRYRQIKDDFAAGKIATIHDLVTHNLDIRKFAEDWVTNIQDPVTLQAFYFHCLAQVTVLDPAVGSGAFLFAALNMLEPLYEICLDKMEELDGLKCPDFAAELKRVSQHPNRPYFILKSIIVNNLFGVDIMEEAVEICKLRLFLKLMAQVDDVNKIEPLPDIDFNIRAGNSLVGYTNLEQIREITRVGGAQGKMDLGGAIERIDQSAQAVDRAFQSFRASQTRVDIDSRESNKAKAALHQDLSKLQDKFNLYLAGEYGIDVTKIASYERWLSTHQPFHWFVEFYGITKAGGFDVIIGNPPYVEYSKVRNEYKVKGYCTITCGNLFPLFIERASNLISNAGHIGIILQHSGFCTPRMQPLIELVRQQSSDLHATFYECRPGKLFDGIDVRLAIALIKHGRANFKYFAGRYFRFFTEERPFLFNIIKYVDASQVIQPYSLLKIETELEASIAHKMFGNTKSRIGDFIDDDGKAKVFYSYGFRYWAKALNYKPYFKGESSDSSTGDKHLILKKDFNPNVLVCILNSSLFYWYYSVYSDGHNFTKTVIYDFPFDYPSTDVEESLSSLCDELMRDLKRNSKVKVAYYKSTGRIEYDEYYVYKSKHIIDKIDHVLAKHYGFTEEELDFIINYDIKYRMGQDNEEE